MAKTTAAPTPPDFDENALKAWVLAEIAKANPAPIDPPGMEKLVKEAVAAECEDIKSWVRREVALNASGASAAEREVMNR